MQSGTTPAHYACQHGLVDVLATILAFSENQHVVALGDEVRLCVCVWDGGALTSRTPCMLDGCVSLLCVCYFQGWNGLRLAIIYHHANVADFLLENGLCVGGEVRCLCHGWCRCHETPTSLLCAWQKRTTLLLAASFDGFILKKLLDSKHGFDLNETDSVGCLQWAFAANRVAGC